jgi:hypothetical protein
MELLAVVGVFSKPNRASAEWRTAIRDRSVLYTCNWWERLVKRFTPTVQVPTT